jgi:hypothetical protein
MIGCRSSVLQTLQRELIVRTPAPLRLGDSRRDVRYTVAQADGERPVC